MYHTPQGPPTNYIPWPALKEILPPLTPGLDIIITLLPGFLVVFARGENDGVAFVYFPVSPSIPSAMDEIGLSPNHNRTQVFVAFESDKMDRWNNSGLRLHI